VKNTGKTYSGNYARISHLPGISLLESQRKNTGKHFPGKVPFARNIFNVFNELNTGKPLPPTGGNTRCPYSPRGRA